MSITVEAVKSLPDNELDLFVEAAKGRTKDARRAQKTADDCEDQGTGRVGRSAHRHRGARGRPAKVKDDSSNRNGK